MEDIRRNYGQKLLSLTLLQDHLEVLTQESRQNRQTLEAFERAMGEYATHLQTHTAVLLELREATRALASATVQLSAAQPVIQPATPPVVRRGTSNARIGRMRQQRTFRCLLTLLILALFITGLL